MERLAGPQQCLQYLHLPCELGVGGWGVEDLIEERRLRTLGQRIWGL